MHRAWRNMRRLTLVVLALLVGLAPATVHAQGNDALDEAMLDPAEMARIEASVDKAIEYLLRTQRADGTWPSGVGDRNNGINALALLAIMGRGHTPGRGPLRPAVERALGFILATQDDAGLYRSPNRSHGPMYEHGLATLAVIEAMGYMPRPELRHSAQKAVDLMVRSQNKQGGWRYQPQPNDADISVTVMQIVALHAARGARLNVPEKTIERALKYVRSLAVPDGGFGYMSPSNAGPARSAAGILSMQLLGAYDDPAVEKGLDYLARTGFRTNIEHFYYMAYYAMQAHFQAGGERWQSWHPQVRKLLLESQNPDGSFPSFGEGKYNGDARVYSTALGAMCLEVYMHYLPAYQR